MGEQQPNELTRYSKIQLVAIVDQNPAIIFAFADLWKKTREHRKLEAWNHSHWKVGKFDKWILNFSK